MIELSRPRAYGEIKPLHGSTGRPIRCSLREHQWYYDLTADHRHSGDPESLPVWLCDECAGRLAAEVQFAGSDGLCDVVCWYCGAPVPQTERTQP